MLDSRFSEILALAREATDIGRALDNWEHLLELMLKKRVEGQVKWSEAVNLPLQERRLSERFNSEVRTWVDEEIRCCEKQLADLCGQIDKLCASGESDA